MRADKLRRCFLLMALFLALWPAPAAGEKESEEDRSQKSGPPPALVAVAPVTSGIAEPMRDFVGTVYYPRTSRVAAEVEGRIAEVLFEEGDRVKDKQVLVRLSTELLDIAISGTRGTHDQVLVDLEEAEKALNRILPLYEEGSVAEVVYDEHYFKKSRLEKRALVLKSALDRQLLEKEKKSIVAPFSGLVVDQPVEVGEWVDEGGVVATVADDREVDVVVDLPSELLPYLKKGREIDISSGGRSFTARFVSFVPKGDVATRTFAVKLRLKNSAGLVEGMEARASIPVDSRRQGLLVPRDAVIEKFGRAVVFLVEDGMAKMVPVTITGYSGMNAGVRGPGLEEGLRVVTKGNERLRDGQPVRSSP